MKLNFTTTDENDEKALDMLSVLDAGDVETISVTIDNETIVMSHLHDIMMFMTPEGEYLGIEGHQGTTQFRSRVSIPVASIDRLDVTLSEKFFAEIGTTPREAGYAEDNGPHGPGCRCDSTPPDIKAIAEALGVDPSRIHSIDVTFPAGASDDDIEHIITDAIQDKLDNE